MAGGNPAATDDDRARSIGAPSFDTQYSRLLRQEAGRGRKGRRPGWANADPFELTFGAEHVFLEGVEVPRDTRQTRH
jgi:hypothetical protein